MEKMGKIINYGHFREMDFFVMVSVSILAITWSFMLRMEGFKWLCKLDFKEHKYP